MKKCGMKLAQMVVGIFFFLGSVSMASTPISDEPFAPDEHAHGEVTLHVATDSRTMPDGSSALKTIMEALDSARPLLAAGRGVRILIHPGMYKETLVFDVTGESDLLRDTPLTIEGAGDGVLISGLSPEVFDAEWKPVPGQTDIYMEDWPYPFHLYEGPWTGMKRPLPGLAARSEMLYRLSGKPLQPRALEKFLWEGGKDGHWVFKGMNALSVLERPDTFAVALSPDAPGAWRGKVFVRTAPGAGVESLRDIVLPRRLWDGSKTGRLAHFAGKNHLTLRNLTFQHAGTHLLGMALMVQDGGHILIEDCRMINNAGAGLRLHQNRKVMVRRVVCAGNGYNGIGGNSREVVFEDVDLVSNNWRSSHAGWRNWDSAGVKFGGGSRDVVFRRCSAVNNADHGFWNDVYVHNILYESCVAWGNAGHGFFLELTGLDAESNRVERSVSAFNGAGVNISSVRKAAVRDSVLYRNKRAQVILSEWANRKPTTAEAIDTLEIRGTHMEADGGSPLLMMTGALARNGEKIAPALLFSGNHYIAAPGRAPFDVSGKPLDFAGWRNWLKGNGAKAPQDLDSSWLGSESSEWTPGKLKAHAEEILGRPVPGL